MKITRIAKTGKLNQVVAMICSKDGTVIFEERGNCLDDFIVLNAKNFAMKFFRAQLDLKKV
jgi:hypothetical protein